MDKTVATVVQRSHARNQGGLARPQYKPPVRRLPVRKVTALLAALWGIFTAALATWWFIFSIRQLHFIASIDDERTSQLVANQRMLVWEGATLLLMILLGVIALVYISWREFRESQKVKNFFATFSHELKTPLASLQLQVDALADESDPDEQHALLKRIKADTERLGLRIENSLILPGLHDMEVLIEPLQLAPLLSQVQHSWPNLHIESNWTQSPIILGDRRALMSILNNLAQNSMIHGEASQWKVQAKELSKDGKLRIEFVDNGKGFQGDREALGRLFSRFYSGSGSGVGLHLARQLASHMGATLEFPKTEQGFAAALIARTP